MKPLLFTLALIFMAQSTIGTSATYKQLSASIIKKSQLIQDLRDLGADYVIQQGVFQAAKNPLPGSWYELTKTEKVERKITSTVIYYRYTVILTEYDNLAVLRATYVVNFKPSNGGVSISSQSYKIIGGDRNGDPSVGGPSLIDVKPLNDKDISDDYISTLLVDAIVYTIDDAIKSKQLKNADYQIGTIYNVYLANSGYPSAYVSLLTLVDNKGETYRVQITTYSLGDSTYIDGDESGDQAGEEWLPEYVIFPNA